LLTSDLVVEEAARGNAAAAAWRLDALSGIPLLAITDEVLASSKSLIQAGAIPREAVGDPSTSLYLLCTGLTTFSPGITVILITLKRNHWSGAYV
jgi:hypothetical protein